MKKQNHLEHLPCVLNANYNPPVVDYNGKWKGKKWNHMPGGDEVEKKLEFFLYRRGLLKVNRRAAASEYTNNRNN